VGHLSKVAVIGGGSFGTVMANIAANNGFPVSFWMRSDALAAAINEQHVNESLSARLSS
jgi:glycerol-3-phosphate dehydrogenase (NAD(P)+)